MNETIRAQEDSGIRTSTEHRVFLYGDSDWNTVRMKSRAIEAALWGMPIVGMYAMREAFLRDANARYNDIIYWSELPDSRSQIITPNPSSYYIYFNFNTQLGPIVLDIPGAPGTALYGTVLNAWQIPIVDIGTDGEDLGRGGKYLLLPPEYSEKTKPGYIPVKADTHNGYGLFRLAPPSTSLLDKERAMRLVQKIRLYRLDHESNPPSQQHIDVARRPLNGTIPFDETFYAALAAMVDEEPVELKDAVAYAQLRTLGIEKGKPFEPNEHLNDIFKSAIAEVRAGLMEESVTALQPFWRESHWGMHPHTGRYTDFSFLTDDGFYNIDDRALFYYLSFGAAKKLGATTFFLVAMTDVAGQMLFGQKSYHLHIPADVPARHYWSVTVYDLETSAFFRNAPVVALDSRNSNLKKNPNGTVDIYFGPQPPAGKEYNWISTTPGKNWFAYFRFNGPEKEIFTKAWRMPDIESL